MLILSLVSLYLGCASEPQACVTALDVRKGNLVVAVSQGTRCDQTAIVTELAIQDATSHELLWKITHPTGAEINNAAGETRGVVQYGNVPVGFEASGPKPALTAGRKLEVLVKTAGGPGQLVTEMPAW